MCRYLRNLTTKTTKTTKTAGVCQGSPANGRLHPGGTSLRPRDTAIGIQGRWVCFDFVGGGMNCSNYVEMDQGRCDLLCVDSLGLDIDFGASWMGSDGGKGKEHSCNFSHRVLDSLLGRPVLRRSHSSPIRSARSIRYRALPSSFHSIICRFVAMYDPPKGTFSRSARDLTM